MRARRGGESHMTGPARSPAVFDRAFLIGTEEVTEVLLVRHAQQDVDFHTAPTGQIADPPLTVHGPQQARAEDFLGSDCLEGVRQRMLNERSWDVYPFSESSYDFSKRAINAVETAIARSPGERIVIVCHGGGLNAYVGATLRSPPAK